MSVLKRNALRIFENLCLIQWREQVQWFRLAGQALLVQ